MATPHISFSDYGGPEEIIFKITHAGHTTLYSPSHSFHMNNILYVPSLNKNLISVAKFCQTNNVSMELFPWHFLVKDLRTGRNYFKGKTRMIFTASCHQEILKSMLSPQI